MGMYSVINSIRYEIHV